MMGFESAEWEKEKEKNLRCKLELGKPPVHFSKLQKRKHAFGEYVRCFFEDLNVHLKEPKLASGLHLINGR